MIDNFMHAIGFCTFPLLFYIWSVLFIFNCFSCLLIAIWQFSEDHEDYEVRRRILAEVRPKDSLR